MIEIASDSAVNSKITNFNTKVDGDNSHTNIADLLWDPSVFLMLGQALVLSAKHFSHLKVPEGKEEVAVVPEHIIEGNRDIVE